METSICSSITTYKIEKEILTPMRHCQEFHLPKGSEILSFQMQDHMLVFWFRFRADEKEMETRTLCYVQTGLNFDISHLTYLASIQLPTGGGILEAHIFEHRYEAKPAARIIATH